MTIQERAGRTIPKADNKKVLKKRAGETRDIVREVLECYAESRDQLKDFAPYLKGRTATETCRNIWQFWKENIGYRVDAEGVQWIKTPAAVWETKFCDCKSFSVAVAASLYALGINGKFRFASYGSNKELPTHVYVVAETEGREIIIDCVWNRFDDQKRFAKNWDYNMTAIYRISGIKDSRRKGELDIDVHDPDLTEAELDLALNKQKLELEQMIARKKHGIGSVTDDAYQTEIEAHNAALGYIAGKKKNKSGGGSPAAPKQSKKLRKAIKKNDGKGVTKKQAKRLQKAGVTVKKRKEGLLKRVAKGLKKAVTTPVRLAAKTQLPKNAPFFLYLFLNDEKILSKLPDAVQQKREKALHYKSILTDKLSMKESNFMTTIRNGIMNRFGKSPENVLASWMAEWKKTNGIGILPLAILKAAGSGLKMLLGKMGENFAADVEESTPAPEDWGTVSEEVRQQMAKDVQAQPANNDPSTGNGSVKAMSDGSGDYKYRSSSSGSSSGESSETYSSTADDGDEPTGDSAKTKELEAATVKTTIPQDTQEKKDNTVLYLGLAAAGLLLAGSSNNKKRK